MGLKGARHLEGQHCYEQSSTIFALRILSIANKDGVEINADLTFADRTFADRHLLPRHLLTGPGHLLTQTFADFS